jgi:SET domain-containing protein
MNNDVIIGIGNLAGKGVYANKDFRKGEVVIEYHLLPLTDEERDNLSEGEKIFTHMHRGVTYLYGEPERYVNHSDNPNTHQDLTNRHDVALRDIKKGEKITTDATKDDTA